MVKSFQLKKKRAGHIEQPHPLFKIANSELFISARARAIELSKVAFDSHSLMDYPFNMKLLVKHLHGLLFCIIVYILLNVHFVCICALSV